MQQSDVDRTINLLFKSLDLSLRSATTLSEILYGALDCFDKNRDAKFLNKHLKSNGKVAFIECSQEASRVITQKMKQKGIRFVETELTSKSGAKVIVFADRDAKDVDAIVNEYRCTRNKGGIISKEMLNAQSRGNMCKIMGLDKYTAMLIATCAKNQGVNIAIENPDSGHYNIVYDRADRKEMQSVKMTAAIQKAHPDAFAGYQKQVDYEEKAVADVQGKVLGNKTGTPVYVADLNGNTMIATADKITYREHGGYETIIDYSDSNREGSINQFLMIMNNPRELTAEQFAAYERGSLMEKKMLLVEVDKQMGRPMYTEQEMTDMRKANDSRILYEQKLSMDNPEQELYAYSYLDNEMKMAAFQEFEKINRESVHDEKELRESNTPIIYDDARSMYRGMRDEEEQMDYEDERYAKNMMSDEPDMDLAAYEIDDMSIDISNDLNNNLIPDDYEMMNGGGY